MKGRARLAVSVAVLAAMCHPLVAWPVEAGQAELPLPEDVQGPLSFYHLVIGSQPVKAGGFTTSLPSEKVRAFYEQELPRHGWTISVLPWMAKATEQGQAITRAKQEHAEEIAQHPQLKALLDQVDVSGLNQLQKRLIYAVNGSEQVLLNLSSKGQQTVVVINRWRKPSGKPDLLSGEGLPLDADGRADHSAISLPAQAAGGPFDPTRDSRADSWVNVCCSKDEVSNPLRQLPPAVPRYPTGRMIATASNSPRRAQTAFTATEMYLTNDSVEQVVDFYRRHMGLNGWGPVESPAYRRPQWGEPLVPGFKSLKIEMLSFRLGSSMCSVVVSEVAPMRPADVVPQDEQPGWAETPALQEQVKQLYEAAKMERTLITVSYVESRVLGRSPSDVLTRPQGHR